MNPTTYNHPTLNVQITLSPEGCLAFTVDNKYNWTNNSNRVAITRWLLKTWKDEILPLKDFFFCVPHGEDKNGEGKDYRRKIFSKLGFVQTPAPHSKYMHWGTLSSEVVAVFAELKIKEDYSYRQSLLEGFGSEEEVDAYLRWCEEHGN